MSDITLIETNINIGVENPFSFLHISDTHLVYADERDGERKINLAKERAGGFIPEPEKVLSDAEKIACDNSLPIVHTGDIMDFVSQANLDRVRKFINENDVLFIAGNHDFSLYVGEAKEDAAYRNKSLAYVQGAFKEDIRFNSRVLNGINFVGVDNGYYLFEEEQLKSLKKEVEKGYPIILYMHVPIFNRELYDFTLPIFSNTAAYLVGTPDELISLYEPSRAEQQKPDKATMEFIKYVKEQPLIKCILTGHIHSDFEDRLTETLPQFLTGKSTVRKINVT